MALDFPASPSTGATYTGPNGVVWIWDGTKWTVGTQSGAYLPLSGGVLTGDLTVKTTAGYSTLNLDSSPGTAMQITGQRNGSARWLLRLGSDDAETGSSAGSDFTLHRYNDAGVIVAQALSISRATGVAAFTSTPIAPTTAPGTNTTQLATTAFVAAREPVAWTVGCVPFATGAQTLGQDVSLFWDNGNKRLGISTAGPTRTLEVFGNASALNFEIGQSRTTDIGTVGFTNANGPSITFRGSGAATPGIMQFSTSGVEAMRIDASQQALFQKPVFLAANAHITPLADNNNYCGSPTLAFFQNNSHNYATISDPAKKTDIASIPEGALAQVVALAPQAYRWREGPDERRHMGFMADQVRDTFGADFGGVVEDEGRAVGVQFDDLTAVLWQAVRELKAELDSLKGTRK